MVVQAALTVLARQTRRGNTSSRSVPSLHLCGLYQRLQLLGIIALNLGSLLEEFLGLRGEHLALANASVDRLERILCSERRSDRASREWAYP